VVSLNSDSRPIIGRGPSLGARLFLLLALSITVMVVDHRGHHLDNVRRWLGSVAQPLYLLIQTPFEAWDWATGSVADRAQLRKENQRLQTELRDANTRLLQFDSMVEENHRLRDIRASTESVGGKNLIAEILRVDVDPFRHRLLINKGTRDNVFKGQSVLDSHGVVGQVTRVGMFTSEIILISDAEHAIPVQLNRTGIRTIAVGTGDMGKLSLPYLTGETDVKVGDLLVTSGLGGIFPAGYPVATVSKVERSPAETFATVDGKPLAQLDRDREVLLLWFKEPELLEPNAPSGTPPKRSSP
jgi:rod shape-determining protein MreC